MISDFRDFSNIAPDIPNFNAYSDYTNPELDHIDLIAEQVSVLIPPGNPDYHKDTVTTTHVIAHFDGNNGIEDANGLESQVIRKSQMIGLICLLPGPMKMTSIILRNSSSL